MEPRFVRLADARMLAYSEYGDPAGTPVINCHGGLTGRRDIEGWAESADAVGVRLISPDRPGIGSSDPQPGRTLLDWPMDVAALADRLGVARFAVLGWSAGGAYAAACGFALPDRVSAVALMASVIPPDWPGMDRELSRMDRAFIGLSRRAPHAQRLVFLTMATVAERAPAAFRRLSSMSLDKPSREVVMSASAAAFSAPMAEGLRAPAGVVDDYRVLASPWGFDPAEITPRVLIRQGDSDRMVPASWAARLAARIPDADVRIWSGEGHFLPREAYREIFAALKNPPGAQGGGPQPTGGPPNPSSLPSGSR
jgi:pimeloyl-ACP methyl ester carboxylesterase